MTTTLAALQQDGVRLNWVLAIEGFPYLITTGSASAAATAWTGAGYVGAVGGLEVQLERQQSLHPWEPMRASTRLLCKVMDEDGNDRLGKAAFRREGGTESRLNADVPAFDPIGTDIAVLDASGFSADDIVHIGTEAIEVGGVSSNTLTGCTRGLYSPFATSDGSPLARSHRLSSGIPGLPPSASPTTIVRDRQHIWKGRGVALYLHTSSRSHAGVESFNVKADALCQFVGTIADVRDEDTLTIIECTELTKALTDGVVFREQFAGRLKEGIRLTAGQFFKLTDRRDSTSKTADPLVVVPSGATPPLQINAGVVALGDLEGALQDWMADQFNLSNLNFNWTFSFRFATPDGTRSRVRFDDPTAGPAVRVGEFTMSVPLMKPMGFTSFGGGTITVGSAIAFDSFTSKSYTSESPAVRVDTNFQQPGVTLPLVLEDVTGTYIDQSDFLPAGLDATNYTGIIQVGDYLLMSSTPSGTADSTTVNAQYDALLRAKLGNNGTSFPTPLTVDDEGTVPVRQILALQGTWAQIFLGMLVSTGSTGYNHPDYDVFPTQLGLGLPWSALTDDFETELLAAPASTSSVTTILTKPAIFSSLFAGDFTFRWLALVWRQGRYALRSWSTPTTTPTQDALDETNTGFVPAGNQDAGHATAIDTDEFRSPIIKLQYNRDPLADKYLDTLTIADTGEADMDASKPTTLSLPHFVAGSGAIGADLFSVLPVFMASMPFVTRTLLKIHVIGGTTIGETHTPGETVLFTDRWTRDPATGTRGITARPALIIGQSWTLGGSALMVNGVGGSRDANHELDLLVFPGHTLAVYAPAARVDEGATTAGYVAGTKTLTFKTHVYTDPVVDAAHDLDSFAVGNAVTVIQIDPGTAASPQSWNDIIASKPTQDTCVLTTGLAGYDTTGATLYKMIPRDYANATGQTDKCFQADDADELIEDARAAYGYALTPFFSTFSPAAYEDKPARHATAAYGDGRPLDTGFAQESARNANHLIGYKTAPQCPRVYSESTTFTGGGTWQLVECSPRFLGFGTLDNQRDRALYVSPIFRSTDGSTASVRVTLSSTRPTGTTNDDITTPPQAATHTFTTTSTSKQAPTAVGLSIIATGLRLTDVLLGGIGWVSIEITDKTELWGLGEMWLGPPTGSI